GTTADLRRRPRDRKIARQFRTNDDEPPFGLPLREQPGPLAGGPAVITHRPPHETGTDENLRCHGKASRKPRTASGMPCCIRSLWPASGGNTPCFGSLARSSIIRPKATLVVVSCTP